MTVIDVPEILAELEKLDPNATNPYLAFPDDDADDVYDETDDPTPTTATGVARTCLYTSRRDENRHCIAGQLFVNLGFEPISPDVQEGVSSVVDLLLDQTVGAFTGEAVDFLTSLQKAADGEPVYGRSADGIAVSLADESAPRPWAEAIRLAKEANHL